MRTQFSKLVLAASLGLAMAFTFGCSSDDKSDDGGGGGSGTGNGKGNNIANYKTKQIGTQVWMAENLNYAIEGSKCGFDYYLKDDNTENCNKYGRLYNWATAMALPLKCNSKLSTSEAGCAIGTPHQGICPAGWHIPNNDDWDKLLRYVDSENGGNGYDDIEGLYRSITAGKYLKATGGWNDFYNHNNSSYNNGNGTDKYSFAALPGGMGGDFFQDVGSNGYWWSASELNAYSTYYRTISSSFDGVYWNDDNGGKSYFLSVRCLKD